MNAEQQARFAELIERRLDGSITDAEAEQLEASLLSDAAARELFLDLSRQHAALMQMGDALVQEELHASLAGHASLRSRSGRRWWLGVAAAAAAVAIAAVAWWPSSKDEVVATLVSAEHAAWESSLPTAPDSALQAGFLKLKTGIATIRFRSGAEVVLEAPAHLVLETPMRARLLEGSAVVDVPESAIGFVIETPDGRAVDHGTQFAVSVDAAARRSSFEVLSGEISVHHPRGEERRLADQQRIAVEAGGLVEVSDPEEDGTLPSAADWLRISTGGRDLSAIRQDDLRADRLHPDFLMVKQSTLSEDYNRRSLFAFDLSQLGSGDDGKIEGARLRLNLVSCGLGFASRLPEISRFAVYAYPGPAASIDWSPGGLRWPQLPDVAGGELIGRFEVSRGQSSGSFLVETAELRSFLEAHRGGEMVCLLLRESDEAESGALVHAFASSRHPEASGPLLEVRSTGEK